MIAFVWDGRKAAVNARKHGVGFDEAASVFSDPLSVTIADPAHSIGETRLVTMGLSVSGRILVVVHVDRGDEIRVVSARKATPREKRQYDGEEQG